MNKIFLKGHSSTVVHMDWSDDSKYIQSDSSDCEILYCKYFYKFKSTNKQTSKQKKKRNSKN